MEEAIIIGAGPCGLAAAVELQAVGVDPLVLEKDMVVHSIFRYPTYMQFFSTAALLEIGGVPFTTPNEKPTRLEALTYYREVALRSKVRMKQYEEALRVRNDGEGFAVDTVDRQGAVHTYRAKKVIVATGYFDHPNRLGIPGEELPKVSHFFREAHPYTGSRVVIIGGNNSAVDAALELLRVGAEVTVVYRGETFSPRIKPWVRPTFEGLVNKERIAMRFASRVIRIEPGTVTIECPAGDDTIANDFVLALTGFHPDRDFLQAAGVRLGEDGQPPVYDPDTMETNVPGLYLAGVVAASAHDANEIFIESGRFHGQKIAAHLAAAQN